VPAVLVTHDFAEAYRLGDRIVVYEAGRVIQSAPRSELLWQPASEAVARIMGIRNILHGTVIKASPDRIQLRWRGLTMEAVNSPTQAYLPSSEAPIAFFIRPEYVRLIRKDRGAPDPGHHMNLMSGRVVAEADFGTTVALMIRLDEPGEPAQGGIGLLESPDRGEVRVHGHIVSAATAPAERRTMATVFQQALLADTTVTANVGLGLRFRGVPADARRTRVTRWLERFGIADL